MRPQTPRRLLFASDYLQAWQQDHWQWVRRPQGDWGVTILAITAERRVVLVEQYRYPLNGPVIELPAGMVEQARPTKSDLLAAARTELLEETGYRAGSVELLCSGPVAPGIIGETQALVRAGDLEKVGAGGGVERERITVHEVLLDELAAWLNEQRRAGRIVDLKVDLALAYTH